MGRAEKFWDGRAKSFDGDDGPEENSGNETAEKLRQFVRSDDTVLDYGCATGTLALALAGSVGEIYGIDISSKMIDIAQRKAQERQIDNVHFTRSTIADAPFQPASFDAILAFNIFHLLDDAQSAVYSVNRLLKPGGLFISETPSLGDSGIALRFLFRGLGRLGVVPHLTIFKMSDVDAMVVGNGFEIIESEVVSGGTPSNFVVAIKRQ